jgi:integrase
MFKNRIRIRSGTTKNDVGLWKPIPPDMLNYFRTLPNDTEHLFYRRDRDGVCRTVGTFWRSWKRLRKLAGMEGLRLHDTRHVSATDMIDNGAPEQVVMTVAGWKTNMLRAYYHREPGRAMELIQWTGSQKG